MPRLTINVANRCCRTQLQAPFVHAQHRLEHAFGNPVKPAMVFFAPAAGGTGCTTSASDVSDTTPEIRIDATMATENSRNSRPMIPPMNNTRNEHRRQRDRHRQDREPDLARAFQRRFQRRSPISMWRMMFSSMTIASSTTNPIDKRQRHQREIVDA